MITLNVHIYGTSRCIISIKVIQVHHHYNKGLFTTLHENAGKQLTILNDPFKCFRFIFFETTYFNLHLKNKDIQLPRKVLKSPEKFPVDHDLSWNLEANGDLTIIGININRYVCMIETTIGLRVPKPRIFSYANDLEKIKTANERVSGS